MNIDLAKEKSKIDTNINKNQYDKKLEFKQDSLEINDAFNKLGLKRKRDSNQNKEIIKYKT